MKGTQSINPAAIALWIVTVLGLGAALLIGMSVAHADYSKITIIFSSFFALWIGLGLKRNIWLLIPILWSLTGQILVIPLPVSVRELGVLAAFGMFVVYSIFKVVSVQGKAGWMDLLVWLNVAYIGLTFIRNPVGVAGLGSDLVGGRPYFDILVGLLAFWVLCRVQLSSFMVRFLPIFVVLSDAFVAAIGTVTYVFPSLVPYIRPIYSGVDISSYITAEYQGNDIQETDQSRFDELFPFAKSMFTALFSYFRPVSVFLPARPVAFILCVFATAALFLSGYRSGLIYTGVIFFISSSIRGRVGDVLPAILAALLLVSVAAGGNGSLFKLPFAAQRALSFLPGNWDTAAVDNAEASSDWRFQIWQIVLSSNKYIKNKVLGDGFGFSAHDLQIQLGSSTGGTGYIGEANYENQLITGAYHSGPLSAVRYVGVIGLFLFLWLLFYQAKFAWRLAKRAQGTPYFPIALFFGLPVIYQPINYIFVFGGYDSDASQALFVAGMLKLLNSSLQAYREKQAVPTPDPLQDAVPPVPAFQGI